MIGHKEGGVNPLHYLFNFTDDAVEESRETQCDIINLKRLNSLPREIFGSSAPQMQHPWTEES